MSRAYKSKSLLQCNHVMCKYCHFFLYLAVVCVCLLACGSLYLLYSMTISSHSNTSVLSAMQVATSKTSSTAQSSDLPPTVRTFRQVNRVWETIQPMKDITYDKSGSQNTDRSVFVTPRTAYYDPRLVEGKPINEIVVLAEVRDDANDSILACEVNGHFSDSVRLITEDATWARQNFKSYTHLYLLIWCAGLPQEAVVNNTVVRIIYKKSGEDFYSRVEAEMPLFLANHTDNDPLTFDKGKGSIVVCSGLFDHPPMFDQWLKYQQTLNVDMVHLNVDTSFYNNATQVYPFLKEALETGFVQMHEWKNIINDRAFYNSQLAKSHDCLYRYIGVFEYAFVIDVDDFVTPTLSEHKDIHFYLNRIVADTYVGAVCFKWQQMKCKPIPEKITTLPDGNLTSILSGTRAEWRVPPKSAYRLNTVLNIKVHGVHRLQQGYRRIIAWPNRDKIYVAHLRDSEKAC